MHHYYISLTRLLRFLLNIFFSLDLSAPVCRHFQGYLGYQLKPKNRQSPPAFISQQTCTYYLPYLTFKVSALATCRTKSKYIGYEKPASQRINKAINPAGPLAWRFCLLACFSSSVGQPARSDCKVNHLLRHLTSKLRQTPTNCPSVRPLSPSPTGQKFSNSTEKSDTLQSPRTFWRISRVLSFSTLRNLHSDIAYFG